MQLWYQRCQRACAAYLVFSEVIHSTGQYRFPPNGRGQVAYWQSELGVVWYKPGRTPRI